MKTQRDSFLKNGQARRHTTGGQALLFAIIAIGGTILGATTIAGYLMTLQLRQSNDAANSAKAVFAAESGINCGLYNFLHPGLPGTRFPAGSACLSAATTTANRITLSYGDAKPSNDSYADFGCYKNDGVTVISCRGTEAAYIFSRGTAGTAQRAFFYTISR